jgi:hypothetical protein
MQNTQKNYSVWVKLLDGTDEIRSLIKFEGYVPIRQDWPDGLVAAFAGYTKSGLMKYRQTKNE